MKRLFRLAPQLFPKDHGAETMLSLLYALAAYLLFFATFLYAIGFTGGFWVPRHLDGPGAWTLLQAMPVNAALLALFAVQHSVMARPWFKRAWTRVVPVQAERSTYVALSSLVLLLLFLCWRPVTAVVWDFPSPAGRAVFHSLFILGWGLVLLSTFLISHTDLFGLRQALLHFQDRAYLPPAFQVRWLYRLVRHPLMLGFLVAFWSTPRMTVGHLLFALANTVYILIALRFEERDLKATLGAPYQEYKRKVPMLLPFGKR
jgi:protein-S-isoprenylcysteine O-methyltransferase Ste14